MKMNSIVINPYYVLYKYNINYFSKLYKHTRMIKSGCKNKSSDCDKKDNKDITTAGGQEICDHLTRYDVTNSNKWKRRQI